MSHPIHKPNGGRPTTVSNWTTFVDAWAQYHNVAMHAPARDALINACKNALGEANAPVQSIATAPRRHVRQPPANAAQAAVRVSEQTGTDPYLAGIAARHDPEPTARPTVRRITRPAR